MCFAVPTDIVGRTQAEHSCYQGERSRCLSALLGNLENLSKRAYLRKAHLSVHSDREIKEYYLPWSFLP